MSNGEVDEVTTALVENDRRSQDLQIRGGGPDGAALAYAFEEAFTTALKKQMRHPQFSGLIQFVVLGSTPPPERKYLPPMIEQLRRSVTELKGKEGPYRVTMTYQKDTSSAQQGRGSAVASAEASTGGGTSLGRVGVLLAVGVVLAVVAFVATRFTRSSTTFPDTVDYGEQHLTKATDWLREGVSGGVYVAQGQKLPSADLQVSVMLSTARTAEALDAWIRREYIRTKPKRLYDGEPGTDTCRIGVTGSKKDERTFIAVEFCKQTDERTVCAEHSEPVPESVLTSCQESADGEACFSEACIRQRLDKHAPLESVVDSFLTTK
jgi:hypothetical protein